MSSADGPARARYRESTRRPISTLLRCQGARPSSLAREGGGRAPGRLEEPPETSSITAAPNTNHDRLLLNMLVSSYVELARDATGVRHSRRLMEARLGT